MNSPFHPRDQLIVALDAPDANTTFHLAKRLGDDVPFFKIETRILASDPVGIGRELRQRSFRVFLDRKLFDFDSIVRRAVAGGINRAAPDRFSVHGYPRVLAADRLARGKATTRMLAVSVPTGPTPWDLPQMMTQSGEMAAIVGTRARWALHAGPNGLIAAPTDVTAVRSPGHLCESTNIDTRHPNA